MLKLYNNAKELDIAQLLLVYRESIENRMETERLNKFRAEQKFIDYMREDFFSVKHTICAMWLNESVYVSALRLEPYLDGFLLTGLETAPERRRKGYARCLLNAVLKELKKTEHLPVYTHVDKRNTPSLSLHTSCGFREILDYGKLIDGTVSYNYCTLCYKD